MKDKIGMEDETVEGAITLTGEDVLVGMEFLRALGKSLTIGPNLVSLVDYP